MIKSLWGVQYMSCVGRCCWIAKRDRFRNMVYLLFNHVTRLLDREYYIEFSRRESFKIYIIYFVRMLVCVHYYMKYVRV